MTVSDDDFARLFSYVQEQFDSLRTELKTKADKNDIEKIVNLLDATTKRLNDHDIEIAALVDTSRRHEDSLETLAAKLKVKLNTAKA